MASSLHAQDYVQYLVPVVINNAAGTNGSLWTTEFTIHNPRDKELAVLSSPSFTVPPFSSRKVDLTQRGGFDGVFLYVPLDVSAPPTPMTLRARDLSKSAEAFGTEVPIVRISQFSRSLTITDIPTDARYRATLRIYGSNEYPRDLVMRVYTLEGQTPVEERSVHLDGIIPIVFDPTPLHPGYAQLDPLTPAVRAAGERVRIEIFDPLEPITSPPPPPIWAFVSITNTDTQQVTTITPHP